MKALTRKVSGLESEIVDLKKNGASQDRKNQEVPQTIIDEEMNTFKVYLTKNSSFEVTDIKDRCSTPKKIPHTGDTNSLERCG